MPVDLTPYNCLRVTTQCARLEQPNDAKTAVATALDILDRGESLTVIGDGSNLVPLRNIDGAVMRVAWRGVRCVEEGVESVLIEVQAGEDWHEFVSRCTAQGWFGLENLSLIPGRVGAAPIQNIGAYGVELEDFIDSVHALDLTSGISHWLPREACGFAYRESLFKQQNHWLVLGLRLRLQRAPRPQTSYADVARELQQQGAIEPSPLELQRAIIAIRQRKLPDPKRIGNVGSFFKNPVVTDKQADALRGQLSAELVTFTTAQGVKLAAAQLIEQCGWKGKTEDGVGVWTKQPLVLINTGATHGSQFVRMARKIADSVYERFGVRLEQEPRTIGHD